MSTEIIIGHLTDELVLQLKAQRCLLKFMYWSKHGLPVHEIIRR